MILILPSPTLNAGILQGVLQSWLNPQSVCQLSPAPQQVFMFRPQMFDDQRVRHTTEYPQSVLEQHEIFFVKTSVPKKGPTDACPIRGFPCCQCNPGQDPPGVKRRRVHFIYWGHESKPQTTNFLWKWWVWTPKLTHAPLTWNAKSSDRNPLRLKASKLILPLPQADNVELLNTWDIVGLDEAA